MVAEGKALLDGLRRHPSRIGSCVVWQADSPNWRRGHWHGRLGAFSFVRCIERRRLQTFEQAAAALRDGTKSSRDLVETCLDRIADPSGPRRRGFRACLWRSRARIMADAMDALRRIGRRARSVCRHTDQPEGSVRCRGRNNQGGLGSFERCAASGGACCCCPAASGSWLGTDRPHQYDRVRF